MTRWSTKLESVLTQLSAHVNTNKHAHIRLANHYINIYNKLTIVGICLGPISVVMTGLGGTCDTTFTGITYSNMILSMVSSIIFSIIKFGKYEETSNLNKIASIDYEILENNIKININLDIDTRPEPVKYMEWVQHKFDTILKNSPLLPDSLDEESFNVPNMDTIADITTDDKLLEYERMRMFENN